MLHTLKTHQALTWRDRRPAGVRSLPEQSRDFSSHSGQQSTRCKARVSGASTGERRWPGMSLLSSGLSPALRPKASCFRISSLNEGIKTSCSKMTATRLRIKSPLFPDRRGSGKEGQFCRRESRSSLPLLLEWLGTLR